MKKTNKLHKRMSHTDQDLVQQWKSMTIIFKKLIKQQKVISKP
jgi:hypothetical protein